MRPIIIGDMEDKKNDRPFGKSRCRKRTVLFTRNGLQYYVDKEGRIQSREIEDDVDK